MKITIIYELNPNSDTDNVVALIEDPEDATKAVLALNRKAQDVSQAAHGNDWEEYAHYYYSKECPVITSEDLISSL